jgi:hypothetical protein
MSPIPLHLVIEDELSEIVIRRVLADTQKDYSVGSAYGRTGFGYLRSTANNWNAAAAAGTPILLLTDLDQHDCPVELIAEWMNHPCHANFLFRIAVREVESWLLADREGFSHFLGISNVLVPAEPDQVNDPKRTLINLARRSRRTAVKRSIVPRQGSTAIQGPDYNGCLGDFVRNQWNSNTAKDRSPSLNRAWQRVMSFEPVWPPQEH